MTISLTPAQQALLARLVESGRYASADEALGEALRLLERETQLVEKTKRRLQQSIDEANRGESLPFDQALVDRIKAEGRAVVVDRSGGGRE